MIYPAPRSHQPMLMLFRLVLNNSGVVGVTTNPSIFSAAISGAAEYAALISRR
jgi:transaldolase